MRHILRALGLLAWDFIACRDERHVNEGRPTVFDAHSLDADTVAELVADDEIFQQMCFERWEAEL